MVKRKDLPLEEKLKIPVMKLPFSKAVKNELYYKGVLTLGQIYDKYQREPRRSYLPGFKDSVFLETAYLIIDIGLDNGKYKLAEEVDFKLSFLDEYYKDTRERKEKIMGYANAEI